ncbi:MAG: stage III sporulation protein AB [Lachnospiraceae bacterium]|nr:stage III sporulation protein AB [Lachnospiraceae bacterium]
MRIFLKMGGLLCIFAASCMLGFEMDRRLKQRWLFFQEVTESLQLLEKEMTWLRTPLPEALRSAAAHGTTAFSSMLISCAEQVAARDRRSFGEIWRECAAKEIPAGFLQEAEYQALLDVEEALCGADLVLQRTHLQRQQQRFEDLAERAKEEWQQKGTLCRRLSAAAGASLVILLL